MMKSLYQIRKKMWGTWPNIFDNKSDKRRNVDSCMCIAEAVGGAVLRDYVFHQLSTLSAPGAENKGNISKRKIFKFDFLKLNPISIHSYEVIMHGIYTSTVTGACLHAELKIWLSPAQCSGCRQGLQWSRGKGNLIPLSLRCKFSNEITLSKDGVYCHLLFDVQQADYVYVESRQRQLST